MDERTLLRDLRRGDAGISAGYAVVAAAYILLSDWLLYHVARNLGDSFWVGLGKGLGFVAVTAVALYVLLRRRHGTFQARIVRSAATEAAITRFLSDLPFLGLATFAPKTGNWVRVTDRFCEMTGYSREELLSRTWMELTHPEDVDREREQLARVERGETGGYVRDKRFVRRDGEVIHVAVDVKCTRGEDGQLDQCVATIHDVTPRVQAERQLESRERRFRTTLEEAPFPVMIHDETGTILLVSRAWREITGYTREDIPTMAAWLEKAFGRRREEAAKQVARLYDLAEPVEEGLHTIHCRDGSERMWKMRSSPLGASLNGGPRSVVSMAADLTALNRAVMGTIETIYRMVELRDPYTAGHERRVGDLAAAIGTEMGLDEETCRGLRVTGYVHDIGKIVVPAEILSKPGPLTEFEQEIVRQHPEVGHDILHTVEFPWAVAEVVLQHHERMDGSGYPRGLSGDAICLEARILAVADVMESMVSHRPYRPSLGEDAALGEIEGGSGTRYDERVVGACTRLFREQGFAFS